MGDRSLEKFRVEYEKLHKALKKSHDSEKRLMQKCRELNAEIVANSAKVATALKLSQEDQATIASLKKVLKWLSLLTVSQKVLLSVYVVHPPNEYKFHQHQIYLLIQGNLFKLHYHCLSNPCI